jgi:hypothetical protein
MLSYGIRKISPLHQKGMWSKAGRNTRNNFEDDIPIEDDCLKFSNLSPLYYQDTDRRVGYRK